MAVFGLFVLIKGARLGCVFMLRGRGLTGRGARPLLPRDYRIREDGAKLKGPARPMRGLLETLSSNCVGLH